MVLDECVTFYHLENWLDKAGVRYRRLPNGSSDSEIAKSLLPDEILLTRDMKFFRDEKDRAILLPINSGHQKRRVKYIDGIKKTVAAMEKSGELRFNIVRGMRMCFGIECTRCFLTFSSGKQYSDHVWHTHIAPGTLS